MVSENSMFWEDFVTTDGKIIRVECPSKFEDEFYETTTNALARGDTWSTAMFDGCHAEFLGVGIVRIDMSKVIGFMN